jgi:hypothetical protein
MSISEQIRDLKAAGLTNQEIVEQLDCSLQHVYSTMWNDRNRDRRLNNQREYYRRNHVPAEPRFWSDEESRRLIKLRRMGLTFTQLAKKFGTSRNAVAGRIHRLLERDQQSA